MYVSYKDLSGFYKLSKKEKEQQFKKDLQSISRIKEHLIIIKEYAKVYNESKGLYKNMAFDAINVHIQAFTEFSVKVSNPFQWDHTPMLPWKALRKLRNILSHRYYLMNDNVVNLVVDHIDGFISNIDDVLNKYK